MAFDRLPNGVQLTPEFLSPGQEAQLLSELEGGPWEDVESLREQHYGWRPAGSLETDRVVDGQAFLGALPTWTKALVGKLHVHAPFDYAPDHLVVRELRREKPARVKTGDARVVAKVVLGGDLALALTEAHGRGKWFLTLPRRSLFVLTEAFDARWTEELRPLPDQDTLLLLSFRRMLVRR